MPAGTGIITGVAHNPAARPLPNAHVELLDDHNHRIASTISDAHGQFRFEGIAAGHYFVELTGNASSRSELSLVAGQSVETHIDQGVELSGVQVVARRLEEARNALNPVTGGSQTVFSQKSLKTLPEGDHTPINEVLLQAPGVSNDQWGQIHVRDDHNDLQYRINGILLPDGVSGFSTVFDTRFAQKIALNTGALPAQFGLRTAGIVDITTRDRFEGGDVDLYGGSNGEFNPSYQFGETVGRFSFYSTGQYLRSGLGIDNPTPEFSAIHDDTRQGKGFAYASYLLAEKTKITALFGVTSARLELPNIPGETPLFPLAGADSATLDDRQYERNLYGILALQGIAGPQLKYQVAAFDRVSATEYQPDFLGDLAFLGVGARLKRKASALGLQADANYSLTETHRLGFGGSVSTEDDRSDNTSLVYETTSAGTPLTPLQSTWITDNNPKNGNTLLSLYLQDEWMPIDPLTINYGVRYDRVNAYVNDQAWSPRLGAVWTLSDRTTLHAGIARYFTPPPNELVSSRSLSVFGNTTNGSAFLGTSSANSPVLAERANYVDMGVSEQLTKELTVGADAYWKHARDLLDEGQFNNALILTPFNYEQAHIYGLELSSAFHRGAFSAYLNLTHQNAQGVDIVSGQFNFTQADLNYINNHYIYLDHDEHLIFSGGASYVMYGTTFGGDFTAGDGLRSGDDNTAKEPWNMQVNVFASRPFHLAELGEFDLRVAALNILDRTNQIRDGTGVGVFTPHYGPRASAFVGITKPFGSL